LRQPDGFQQRLAMAWIARPALGLAAGDEQLEPQSRVPLLRGFEEVEGVAVVTGRFVVGQLVRARSPARVAYSIARAAWTARTEARAQWWASAGRWLSRAPAWMVSMASAIFWLSPARRAALTSS